MTETTWLKMVLKYASLNGWRSLHIRPARRKEVDGKQLWETPVQGDGKGFPDLLLLRDHRMVIAELKAGKNKKSPEQEDWLQAFCRLPHAEVFTWYPHEWEEVQRVLRRD